MRRKCTLPGLLKGANPLYVDLRRNDSPDTYPRVLGQHLNPREEIIDNPTGCWRTVFGDEIEDLDQAVEPRSRPLHAEAHTG